MSANPPDPPEPDTPRSEPDRVDFDPDYVPDAPIFCDVCGSAMEYTASCKIICRNCGYTRDCSDP